MKRAGPIRSFPRPLMPRAFASAFAGPVIRSCRAKPARLRIEECGAGSFVNMTCFCDFISTDR
jgi:hypothetical protein